MADQKTAQRLAIQAKAGALLKDGPQFKPASRFTPDDRARFRKLQYTFASLADEKGQLNVTKLFSDPRKIDVLASFEPQATEFFRSIAVDRNAFDKWTIGLKNAIDKYLALINRYAEAVGE